MARLQDPVLGRRNKTGNNPQEFNSPFPRHRCPSHVSLQCADSSTLPPQPLPVAHSIQSRVQKPGDTQATPNVASSSTCSRTQCARLVSKNAPDHPPRWLPLLPAALRSPNRHRRPPVSAKHSDGSKACVSKQTPDLCVPHSPVHTMTASKRLPTLCGAKRSRSRE